MELVNDTLAPQHEQLQVVPETYKPQLKSYSEPKNLVIGMAKGIESENLVVFAGSLREHCPVTKCHVALFMDYPLTVQTSDIVERYQVETIKLEPEDVPPKYANYHPSSSRWPLIYR
jgi:hypothetical protein